MDSSHTDHIKHKDILLILPFHASQEIPWTVLETAAQATISHLLIFIPSPFFPPSTPFHTIQEYLSRIYTFISKLFYQRNELLIPVDIVIEDLRTRQGGEAFSRDGFKRVINGDQHLESRLRSLLI